MRHLKIALLGGFEASFTSGPPVRISTKKAQALLAFLAHRPGTAFERDRLAALLWGDRDDERARNCLRQTLFVLRQALGNGPSPVLVVGRATVALDATVTEVDVQTFERLATLGGPAALRDAIDLYRGDLLDGLSVSEGPYADWLRDERERLRDLAADAVARLLRWQRQSGQTDAAIATARRLLALEPWEEAAHRALMRLLAQAGHPLLALRQYRLCADILRREFAVDPSAETLQLVEEIRKGMSRGVGTNGHGGAEPPVPVPSSKGTVRAGRGAPAPGQAGSDTDPTLRRRVSAGEVASTHAKVLQLQLELTGQIARLNRTVAGNLKRIISLRAMRNHPAAAVQPPGGG